ncbi:MAG TPA: asparagine synthase (glutamine-hydrolyzing) [Pyrinomonadaceae bacterium]|jgi:asparagine synthase (glutamine-hydrolysing)|nr:asparagine synthase (glutamine-hydrolyzing) [Pyrinomonadaceae bacterium]
MCGFVGYLDLRDQRPIETELLVGMTDKLVHRGPDSAGYFVEGNLGLGFRRLSIIDLEGGDQPIFNEDGSVVVMCNGEIFNYRELRDELKAKGHTFRTGSDVEVLVHLYEDEGVEFLTRLNGQFSFVLYDRRERRLLLARDHFGINPLYYAVADGALVFGSEVKAILAHPLVERRPDLTGLDQIFSFPGIVSPRTMFAGVSSLPSGHYMLADTRIQVREYWDLDYPLAGEAAYDKPEAYYVERLREHFERAVSYRLQADVPVGFYLSGGQDSSMIAAMISRLSPAVQRHSFSIGFNDREINESKYQWLMAKLSGSIHHEILFDWSEIAGRLSDMVYHCECPVKETYNTCSLALSEAAKGAGISVILTGEGADELFAGYVGYRYDQFGSRRPKGRDVESLLEDEARVRMWGDRDIFYESDYYALREVKSALYSDRLNERFPEFDCVNFGLVNKERLRGRHPVHQRSYLDLKLRLADHLLSDHGDRMALANSVEARYPFLDIGLAEFAREIPPGLKLKDFTEKYILKKVAAELIPPQIIKREKFGFRAPGSPYLLRQRVEWIDDLLSYERVKRQGYFNPDTVEALKAQYSEEGFRLHPHLQTDLLLMVLTFNILVDLFELPSLN